ncbi:MAG: GntR family transcriptional regulator [Bryobacterales bacterium]|nr:GntR family transcriptional regulator [Bryobacterales bacterium]
MATAVSKTNPLAEGEVERVYRLLHEWLVSAQLPPGEFLSDVVLAQKCKTSRTPVREACSRLAQDKWLSLIPRKGYLVRPISVREIVELYEFRKVLECFSAEKVAQLATPEHIAQLKNIVAVETNGRPQLDKILLANAAFHLRLAEMAGNQRVIDQLRLALGYVRRLDTLCTQTVPGWIGHRDIIRAIEAHKPGEARKAMAAHIESSLEKMIRLFSS